MTRYNIDLYYTTHFPLAEKYIALYPKSPIESQEVLDKRERIRNSLREEMLHGKKGISGSNNIQLGKLKSAHQMRTGNGNIGHERKEHVESDEDEFLNMGPKRN